MGQQHEPREPLCAVGRHRSERVEAHERADREEHHVESDFTSLDFSSSARVVVCSTARAARGVLHHSGPFGSVMSTLQKAWVNGTTTCPRESSSST